MKKAFSLILIVSMLLSAILSFAAFADDDTVTVDGMTFVRNGENSCELINVDENVTGDVVIPSEVKFNTQTLRVNSMNLYVFDNCQNITSITFPDNARIIAHEMFGGDSPLSSQKLLKRIVMGKNSNIYEWAFAGCESLEEVVIPEGAEIVYLNAFNKCKNLKNVTLPATVSQIVPGFWSGEKSYHYGIEKNEISTDILIDDNNENYKNVDGIIFSKDMTELVYYPNCAPKDYKVPDSVTKIYKYAFGCESLENVTISKNVSDIGIYDYDPVKYSVGDAFSDCSYLKRIDVDEDNEVFLSVDGVLFSKDKKTLIHYPNSKPAFYYKVPDTVDTIFYRAFIQNKTLKCLDASKNILCTLKWCAQLLSADIKDWTGMIGCVNLKNVVVYDDLNSIRIGEAGETGAKLETIYYVGTEEQWNEIITNSDSYIVEEISETQVIFNYKFVRGDCTGDGEIDNKDVVMTFRFCSGTDVNAIIKAMNVNGDSYVDNKDVVSLFRMVSTVQTPEENEPENTEPENEEPEPTPDEYFEFTLLDNDTYSVKAKNYSNLPNDIIIPGEYNGKAVTEIEELAFTGCKINSVIIPEGVVSIGPYAFEDTGVDATIPLSMKSIGDRAFAGKYFTITYKGTKDQWNHIGMADWALRTNYTVYCTDGDIENNYWD